MSLSFQLVMSKYHIKDKIYKKLSKLLSVTNTSAMLGKKNFTGNIFQVYRQQNRPRFLLREEGFNGEKNVLPGKAAGKPG